MLRRGLVGASLPLRAQPTKRPPRAPRLPRPVKADRVFKKTDIRAILEGKDPWGKDAPAKVPKVPVIDIPEGAFKRKRVKETPAEGQATLSEADKARMRNKISMLGHRTDGKRRAVQLEVKTLYPDVDVLKSVEGLVPSANASGALFAVVHVGGTQHKVSERDLILTQKLDAPVGERIRLEKVLAVCGRDFSIFGVPLLNRDVVSVQATVVEQTNTPEVTVFKMKRRKTYRRTYKHTQFMTRLRIDDITVKPALA
eukprot:Opistho-1_new@38017